MDVRVARKAIEECDLFGGLDQSQLGLLLMNADATRFSENELVFAKGQQADETFCLIISGSVNILSDDGDILHSLGQGEVLGEVGVVSPKHKRTVTVMAGETTDVLRWDLKDIQDKLPELTKRLKDLAWKRIARWYE